MLREVEPKNGFVIKNDVTFKPGVYFLPDGLTIEADGTTLDGNGASIIGDNYHGRGISILRKNGVNVKNLRVSNFYHGIYAQDCNNLSVQNCQITGTYEILANSQFLDIWRTADQAWGGGILLLRVSDSFIQNNDLQHQMNGLLTYHCTNLVVKNNITNYCSGWGFYLYETCNSSYTNNYADFCCRFQARPGREWNHGHMGADSAGFLIVYNSCHNKFRRNLARMSGDGFFLAGLTPQYRAVGCDNNLFEENDGSYSPNIAFESTFSKGNIYLRNIANQCNYGFWLGFSSDGILEQNKINGNRQAGIACENGSRFHARNNSFVDNNHGLLLWSKLVREFKEVVPNNTTSHDWTIEGNSFIKNNKAIRIAANQDHGIWKLPESGEFGYPAPRPYNHIMRNNKFSENIMEVDLINTDLITLDGDGEG